ncbi:MAG: hypothetical protein EOP62_03615 [Sphingomonadales bacterium]|nr:MAG: hypothetical protein EOP62_03615 [Sphingomonadales bacterium]
MKPLLAALLALVVATPAFAQASGDAALDKLIRASYRSYLDSETAPRPKIPASARFNATEAECAATAKRIDAKEGADSSMGACGDDYDLFCQCQDAFGLDWAKIDVAITHPDAQRAEAVITFPPMEGLDSDGPALRMMFVRGGKTGWLLDDVWEYAQAEEGEGSYRTRITASIQDMRKRLGMPAWKVPAL